MKKGKEGCKSINFKNLLKYNLNTPSLDGDEKLPFLYVIPACLPAGRRKQESRKLITV